MTGSFHDMDQNQKFHWFNDVAQNQRIDRYLDVAQNKKTDWFSTQLKIRGLIGFLTWHVTD